MCSNYCNGRLQCNTDKPFTNIAHLLSEAVVDSYFPTPKFHTHAKKPMVLGYFECEQMLGLILLERERHTVRITSSTGQTSPSRWLQKSLTEGGIRVSEGCKYRLSLLKYTSESKVCADIVKCCSASFCSPETPSLLSGHIQVQVVSHMVGKGSGSVQISSSS